MQQGKSFVEILNEQVLSDKTVLPTFDRTSMRIQEEIAKEDPDVTLIEELILHDQSLTSQVLRLANSAFYKGLVKVSTVRNAIIRLGIKEVANIVMLLTHQKNFYSKDPFVSKVMKKLWQHSVGCAVGSQWLANHCGFKAIANEAFTAGLLHDVGKLFLLMVIENMKLAKEIDSQPSYTLLNEAMSSLHTEHGSSLLENWNVPEIYCNVAREHHSEKFDSGNVLLVLVRLVDQACNKMGIGLNEDPSLLLAATSEAHVLGLSEVVLAELEIALEDSLSFA